NSNGIFYDASATTAAPSKSTHEILYDTSGVTTTSSSKTSDASPTATSQPSNGRLNVTSEVLEFSSIVVLFVFEQTGSFSGAASTQSQIQSFLVASPGQSGSANQQAMGVTSDGVTRSFD